MQDGDLVRQARTGDPEAREALARAWLRPVYAVALALTRHAADAEEVTQESFARALAALSTLRDPARFGPWIARIARNVARDRRRRPRLAPLGDAEAALPARAERGTDTTDDVLPAWRKLPEDERLVCWLKVVDGMPLRDIAHLVGRSKSAVDRTYRRALARLRSEVSRC